MRAFESLRVNTFPLHTKPPIIYRPFASNKEPCKWSSHWCSQACWCGMWGCISGDHLRRKDHVCGTMPTLEGQVETKERRSRCLTFRRLGEMSPAQKQQEGKLVSLLYLLWGLSLQGCGEALAPSDHQQTSTTWHFTGQLFSSRSQCRTAMCTWGGSQLHRMNPYSCPCTGNTARIIVTTL